MYSQNNEEEVILNYFNDKIGKFIDIGAFHPFSLSNTRKLYELGWSGVYVEPSPICFENFLKIYENEPRIELINKAVVCDDRKEILFFESNGDAVSTTVLEHKNKWQTSGVLFNPIIVQAINIHDLLAKYENEINFVSIDTESTNFEIFNNLTDDFLKSIDMICIEHDTYYNQIKNRMASLGFSQLLLNAENIILAK